MDRTRLHRIGLHVRREIVALNQSMTHPFAADHLGGGCAIGAWTTCQTLNLLHVENEFVVGWYGPACDGDHCWTEVVDEELRLTSTTDRGDILDVTATQFGVRPLVVHVPVESTLGRNYHPVHRGERAETEVRRRAWKNQSPMRYVMRLKEIAARVAEKERA